jgi:3-hydroxyacyl-[acyl-carrier-protein] dehydratase
MLDFDEVRRLLPQSHPFVFIDRVLRVVPFQSIECLKNVSGNEPYFAGHFPEMAIMPGALMMEACAQASALLFRLSAPDDTMTGEDAGHVFVVGKSSSRFLKPVVPGDALKITVEVEKMYSKSAMVKARAEVEGEIVLKASLSFARVDRSSIQRTSAGASSPVAESPM